MGFWNPSPSRSRSGSRTHSHGYAHSTTPSRSEPRGYFVRPTNSRSASSFSNFFGVGTPRGRSYSTRARPRSGFVAKVRKFLRDILDYMRRHPFKVFFLVIMPLITGGALTKILATIGVRLPPSLQSMVGSQMNRGYSENERFYARGGARDPIGGSALPGMGGGIGESIQGAMSIAKMFM